LESMSIGKMPKNKLFM